MKISIFWYRRDLRVKDNVGLYHALKSAYPVLPLFIFDTNILDELEDPNDARVEFIYKELLKLKGYFENKGSSIYIAHGKPIDVFKKLLEDYTIDSVYTNHDYEPYAIKRDNEIKKNLQEKSISFNSFKDQVIFEKNEILTDTGHPYKVYTHYKNKWRTLFNEEMAAPFHSERLTNYYTTKPLPFLTLKSLGFKPTSIEISAPRFIRNVIQTYDQTRDFPYIENGTTHLGIHFRFGTISIREAVLIGLENNDTWLNELVWREFFMQLLYHFPEVVKHNFNKKFNNLNWRYSDEDFEKWSTGKTGYPMVDAGMRQLNQTGIMHNRVRMVCASFLAKHLLLDWRMGERYFADKLLDYDLSANNGNWQWAAGTGADAQPFFRIFNPTLQQQRFDPDFKYIKKWVPEFGTDSYPKPMIEHKAAVERAKKAFAII